MKKRLLAVSLVGLSLLGLTSCNVEIGKPSNSATSVPAESSTSVPQSSSSVPQSSSSVPQSSSSIVQPSSTPALPSASSSSVGVSSSKSSIQTSTAQKKTTQPVPTYQPIDMEFNGVVITQATGYNEAAYVLFEAENAEYNAYYKNVDDSSFTKLDDELVRIDGDSGRVDIVGIKPGSYLCKIEKKNDPNTYSISASMTVRAHDRSGYAHFKYNDGVGAYKNDGTLKNNAVVVYVNEANKNTVQATIGDETYTGLSDILKHSTNENIPVDIRIIGTVGAATWPSITPSVSAYSAATTSTVKGLNDEYLELKNYTEEEIIQGGFNYLDESVYSKLNGLTNKIKYDSSKSEFDSYYNMLDVSGAKNVTVEGIGVDAKIFQWGFTFKSDCKSIEVRNLTFDDYTEDACSFEGSGQDSNLTTISAFTSTRYWVHNNTFDTGVNYWDVCSEQDKHDGDGSTDLKRVAFVTFSYNQYNRCHKTGLVGGSDTQMTASVTFHHNYYNECQSRLPFARQANMHMYNNYYYKTTGNNMQIYAGAYAFIENCYFDQTRNTYTIRSAAVKSYNNIYNECSSSSAVSVNSRCEVVPNSNVFNPTFDMDPDDFYFNNNNNISDVDLMLAPENVPTYVPQYAGAGHLVAINYSLTVIEENAPYVDTRNFATYTTTTPTTPGLYYHSLKKDNVIPAESEVTSKTYVSEKDDKITISDTSDTESTVGYYIFDEAYDAGTVTISLDVDLQAVGSKWNFVRFLDSTGNEVLAVRVANSTKYIAYTVNGDDSTETVIANTAFKANTKYSITLIIDYANNTAKLKIGTYEATIASFNHKIIGLKFMTAITATDRSFTVSNIDVDYR